MATISLCMIVKNEEKLLRRCLDSIHDLVDEIVIVDTGSTDNTKTIAFDYTDKVFDFEWINDFSAARNFSFSKCSMDYIYVADADEYLDEPNRIQFRLLKENIYDEIDIVQMMYMTISNDTVLNIYKEYRPKLFKRLRQFTWINPVHETVRLDPLVFDSDIVVTHDPDGNHAARDLSIFKTLTDKGEYISDDLIKMYATELYKNGTLRDFEASSHYFACIKDFDDLRNYDGEVVLTAKEYYSILISTKYLRLSRDSRFEKYALSANSFLENNNAEINFELGEFYLENKDYEKSMMYFKMARTGNSALDIHTSGDYAINKLIQCCDMLIYQYEEYKLTDGPDNKMESLIKQYRELINKLKVELANWKMPEEKLI